MLILELLMVLWWSSMPGALHTTAVCLLCYSLYIVGGLVGGEPA